jgi:hypothetical protein
MQAQRHQSCSSSSDASPDSTDLARTQNRPLAGQREQLTEVSSQICLYGIGGPFPVSDIVLSINIESKNFGTLVSAVSRCVVKRGSENLDMGSKPLRIFQDHLQCRLMFLSTPEPSQISSSGLPEMEKAMGPASQHL